MVPWNENLPVTKGVNREWRLHRSNAGVPSRINGMYKNFK
jgi:hypothetical protein